MRFFTILASIAAMFTSTAVAEAQVWLGDTVCFEINTTLLHHYFTGQCVISNDYEEGMYIPVEFQYAPVFVISEEGPQVPYGGWHTLVTDNFEIGAGETRTMFLTVQAKDADFPEYLPVWPPNPFLGNAFISGLKDPPSGYLVRFRAWDYYSQTWVYSLATVYVATDLFGGGSPPPEGG